MSNKRSTKKKATKRNPSDSSVENTEGMSMKKGMKAVQGLPLATIGTVAAFAVTGYALWKNRTKIKNYFEDVDLPTRLGALGDTIAEKANSVSSLISGSAKSSSSATGKKSGKQSASSALNDYN